MSRFDHVQYDLHAQNQQAYFKHAFESLDRYITDELADGRSKSLAITKLEEAYMWVGKAIRDDQLSRLGRDPS